ncbi:tRNA (adenosine(37)-N6)-dimethylallyltransferase MiaA [Hyphomicrobium sp.]|uniref:tRNA (adenosine(37)-N6)-dimethylallyltransferase MiaA n=1 Tax=Hyphomicrobium sp. TaxID=82 RepID=UPI002E3355CA|nr:tRNA (adenosine(37)-N6)-dimethylallyltransferase MiaA [Hyphomicrobium sp.]HEX2841220.1 tRNA (adenosine(37)-N6)-dimethylallyltransferase MiaA [Hyphomicrobium sp.]
MTKLNPVLIAGPTASGKSAFALALAERLDGTVINADAMQVYRELRVLTARPSDEDERRAPHRLYGHVPGGEAYSAARYADEARDAISQVQGAGRIPIIVGGTGLYFKALIEGLSPMPAIPEEIRARWRQAAADEGPAALHRILAERDPEMAARLRPSDPQRLTRALEVLEATGRSLAVWQTLPGEPVVAVQDGHAIVVAPDREEMRRRTDARFDGMMAAGAADEVKALLQLGLDADLPVMRALGVKPLSNFVTGRISAEEAAEIAKAETRQYAKRQMTWLRRNMIAWKWTSRKEMESLAAETCDIIQSTP